MKAVDLLMSQIQTLARGTDDLKTFAKEHAPDGWDKEELEIVDAMVNCIMGQCRSVLTAIGEPLKRLRAGGE